VKQSRWQLRQTLSFVLIISGAFWLVIGLAIRLFFS
jgi:hypothetical protein